MIKNFDRTNSKLLQTEIEKALVGVAERFGISIKGIGGKFGASLMLKFECSIIGETGIVLDSKAENLKLYAKHYGLPADVYSKTFYMRGTAYKLIGYNPQAHKMPFIGERSDGKRFKFPEDAVAGLRLRMA